MRNALIKPQPEQDSEGRNIITKKFLRRLCEHDELFETPHLNKHLYLHYMSFTDIRNLEDFFNLKVLWLENNMITKIENLGSLTQLRCLYLHYNCISKIENLEGLTELTTLNLSHNSISVIENLGALESLEDLNLSHNNIQCSANVKGLEEAPLIKILDLRENSIEDSEFLLSSLSGLKELKCLYLKGNGFVDGIKGYRKSFLGNLKGVVFMDDKAVKELERVAVDAWVCGGEEGEREAREKFEERKSEFEKRRGDEEESVVLEKFREKGKKAKEARDLNRHAIAQEKNKIMNSQFRKVEMILKDKALKAGKSGELFEKFKNFNREKICFEKLEELLIQFQFDFEKVWVELKEEYDCTVEGLIELWENYN